LQESCNLGGRLGLKVCGFCLFLLDIDVLGLF